jgi:hypothetical protein
MTRDTMVISPKRTSSMDDDEDDAEKQKWGKSLDRDVEFDP